MSDKLLIQAKRRAIETENANYRALITGIVQQSERYMQLIIENHTKCEKLRQQITDNQRKFNDLGTELLKS